MNGRTLQNRRSTNMEGGGEKPLDPVARLKRDLDARLASRKRRAESPAAGHPGAGAVRPDGGLRHGGHCQPHQISTSSRVDPPRHRASLETSSSSPTTASGGDVSGDAVLPSPRPTPPSRTPGRRVRQIAKSVQ